MSKTGCVWEKVYSEHVMTEYHPESPDRILGVKDVLENTEPGKKAIKLKVTPATKEEISWVHNPAYIDRVESTKGKVVPLDPDTTAGKKSYEAALMAAGGVVACVEGVLSGEVDNAFAFVRPPGHHAEFDRAMGFCLFNNVAIGAEYAIKKHDLKRIAIIDFDIHHGNGTQNFFYKRSDVFYISTHRWPFYPGSGLRHEHGEGLGKGYTLNIPMEKGDDNELINAFKDVVRPLILEYKPELILVSAGYDAHEDDPLGGFSVTREGYKKLTEELVDLANTVCDGKIVFILEGGYNVSALKGCVEDALKVLES